MANISIKTSKSYQAMMPFQRLLLEYERIAISYFLFLLIFMVFQNWQNFFFRFFFYIFKLELILDVLLSFILFTLQNSSDEKAEQRGLK